MWEEKIFATNTHFINEYLNGSSIPNEQKDDQISSLSDKYVKSDTWIYVPYSNRKMESKWKRSNQDSDLRELIQTT